MPPIASVIAVPLEEASSHERFRDPADLAAIRPHGWPRAAPRAVSHGVPCG